MDAKLGYMAICPYHRLTYIGQGGAPCHRCWWWQWERWWCYQSCHYHVIIVMVVVPLSIVGVRVGLVGVGGCGLVGTDIPRVHYKARRPRERL
jgi:hypothetical protein